jgi:hypothetical protein
MKANYYTLQRGSNLKMAKYVCTRLSGVVRSVQRVFAQFGIGGSELRREDRMYTVTHSAATTHRCVEAINQTHTHSLGFRTILPVLTTDQKLELKICISLQLYAEDSFKNRMAWCYGDTSKG